MGAPETQGHAPAGGCMLSLCCEYRVMVQGNFTIGLNETAVGLQVPHWVIASMTNTIPKREAELALATSKKFTVDEALKVGLIDEIGTDKADLLEKCKQFIKKFDRIPPLARGITKQRIREAPLAWMQNNRTQDREQFLKLIKTHAVQQSLQTFVQSLKQKAK